MKKILSILMSIVMIQALTLNVMADSTKSFRIGDNENKATLQGGHYESVEVDATSVYNRGLEDGKNNAPITVKLNNIIVDIGNNGKFPDGTNGKKKYTEENMSQFSLSVSPRNEWFAFKNWEILFIDNDLVYRASWNPIAKTYTSTATLTVATAGVYELGAFGAKPTYGGNGASLTGRFHLQSGGQLKFQMDPARVYYAKPGSTNFYPLLVAGSGGNGFYISGGYDGNGQYFDNYISGGSPRSWTGPASTALDQTSPYNESLMPNQGAGPLTWNVSQSLPCWYLDYYVYGGPGWRGGKNGEVWHGEGATPGGGYAGMNSGTRTSTAGSSHYITQAEATAWGLTDAYSLLAGDGGALNGANAKLTFSGASSSLQRCTVALISED